MERIASRVEAQASSMESRAPASAEPSPSLLRRSARAVLKSIGWKTVLVPLPGPQGIVVVYPHTSNWDFIIGVLYKIGVSLRVRWVGKHTLFRWPLRRLFVRLGGVPIRRNQRSGFVEAVLAEFARGEPMWLAVTPEGTRSRTSSWKSGFYRIALAADLPVGLGYIDYSTRTIGIDTYIKLTGDVAADFDRIRAFYKDKRGRRPENEGDIRLQP
jgi:1-acyl-sn-glycerol-3-phosphate acyltransferase